MTGFFEPSALGPAERAIVRESLASAINVVLSRYIDGKGTCASTCVNHMHDTDKDVWIPCHEAGGAFDDPVSDRAVLQLCQRCPPHKRVQLRRHGLRQPRAQVQAQGLRRR